MFKRPLHVLAAKFRRTFQPAELMKERWVADFSRPERSCFNITPESSFDACLEKSSLFLGLKKNNCMAWLETADRVYVDQVIETRFRFDSMGGYAAAGIMFRVAAQGTYYLALVSSKGNFRLDAVTNNISRPLVGWTETPVFNEQGANLGIIARGDHLMFILNGRWIAEAYDASIPGGHSGFALVSYDTDTAADGGESHTCKAWLDYLSVDSRPATVETEYRRWSNSVETSAESRLRLAESFAALDRFDAAYDQVLKVWKQREEAARSVMATYTDMRSRGELIFAAHMASRLGEYAVAEEYIDACLAGEEMPGGELELNLLSEKAIILCALKKYGELAAFLPGCIKQAQAEEAGESLPSLYALWGHAAWNLQEYQAAADAWDRAFGLNGNNGLYAAGAADSWEMLGKKTETLKRRIAAGRCFLAQEDHRELEKLVPKLLDGGKKNWEAHDIAGKWALAAGDTGRAEAELSLADKLKNAAKTPRTGPVASPAEKKPPKAQPQKKKSAGTSRAPEKRESAPGKKAVKKPAAEARKAKKEPVGKKPKTTAKSPAKPKR